MKTAAQVVAEMMDTQIASYRTCNQAVRSTRHPVHDPGHTPTGPLSGSHLINTFDDSSGDQMGLGNLRLSPGHDPFPKGESDRFPN